MIKKVFFIILSISITGLCQGNDIRIIMVDNDKIIAKKGDDAGIENNDYFYIISKDKRKPDTLGIAKVVLTNEQIVGLRIKELFKNAIVSKNAILVPFLKNDDFVGAKKWNPKIREKNLYFSIRGGTNKIFSDNGEIKKYYKGNVAFAGHICWRLNKNIGFDIGGGYSKINVNESEINDEQKNVELAPNAYYSMYYDYRASVARYGEFLCKVSLLGQDETYKISLLIGYAGFNFTNSNIKKIESIEYYKPSGGYAKSPTGNTVVLADIGLSGYQHAFAIGIEMAISINRSVIFKLSPNFYIFPNQSDYQYLIVTAGLSFPLF